MPLITKVWWQIYALRMKKQILLFFAALFLMSNFGHAHQVQKVFGTHTAYVSEGLTFFTDDSILKKLTKRKDLIVGHPTPDGFEVYGDKNLYALLDELKVPHTRINYSTKGSLKSLGHPSYDEITEKMKELSETYNGFMTLESIGKSVKERELWLMRVGFEDEEVVDKKHILYIANMHGDEITGRELMLMLIEELGERYVNEDNEVLSLLDQMVIHILPSMNPDGAERKRRANANWVDLNRDFPDWTRGNANTTDGREPEVQAVMNYYKRYHFSLSANFHGGAQVVNYPWDNSSDEGKLEDFLKQLSLDYISNGAEYMKSSSFPEGIIRGYDWYPVYGGLQDWSTHYYNSPHLTIELSNRKWPHFDDMSYFYENNRLSLLKMPNAMNSTRAGVFQ